MIIVLDGPDHTGKSTIAKLFADLLPAKVIHTVRKPFSSKQDLSFERELIELPKHKMYILDRHTPSDIAYGLLRGENVDHFTISWRLFQSSTKVLPIYLTRSPGYSYSGEHIGLNFRQDCTVIRNYKQLAMLDNVPTWNVLEKGQINNLLQFVRNHEA